MSFIPEQILDLSPFNELRTVESSPIVQASPEYGVRDNMYLVNSGAGASVTAVDSNFVITSGNTAAGFSTCLTLKHSRYRSGQSLNNRISAIFGTPQPLSQQGAGLISTENYLVFGYNNTDFGILRGYNAKAELRTLTVTAAATVAGNVTVTVNGVAYVVAVTIGTTQHVAYQIASSLKIQDTAHTYASNGNTVEVLAIFAGPQVGAWTYAAGATGTVAAFTQQVAGVAATVEFIALADWDNPPTWAFDPALGNVYNITLQWLGYGEIKFGIENPETGRIEIVHSIKYANTSILPNVSNPVFRLGWVARNLGNTTPLIVKGCSTASFVEGKIVFSERPRSISANLIGATTTETTLITLRNRSTINNRHNRENIIPKILAIATESSKGAIITLAFNNVTTGDLIFAYVDQVNSIAEYSLSNITVTSLGKVIGQFVVRVGQTLLLPMNEIFNEIYPTETLFISSRIISGAASDTQASFVWLEDF